MQDGEIIELYFKRDEAAIKETDIKYGAYCHTVAMNILKDIFDAEECVNDTYLEAWQSMPTDRPTYLGSYLSKIIRCISIDRFRSAHAEKRGEAVSLTDELCQCLASRDTPEAEYERGRTVEAINRFLRGLDEEKRRMFVRRYFYSDSIADVAGRLNVSVPKVKTTLHRLRSELREYLEKEGIYV